MTEKLRGKTMTKNRAHTAKNLLVWAFSLLLWWPVPQVQGAQRHEDPNEPLVRNIAKDLRCAVCQNQSIYESNSDLARDMLAIIRDKVQAGESEKTIRHYFFQRYGDYIYLEPTQDGKNKILWLGPFLGLLIGGGTLWAAITRWKKQGATTREMAESNVQTQEDRSRIKQELERVQL